MDEEIIRIVVIVVFLAFSFVGKFLKKKNQPDNKTDREYETTDRPEDIFEQLKEIINSERQAPPPVEEYEDLEPQEMETEPEVATDLPWYHKPSYLRDEPEHETGLTEIHNNNFEEGQQETKVHPLMKGWDPKKAILYAEILKRPNF